MCFVPTTKHTLILCYYSPENQESLRVAKKLRQNPGLYSYNAIDVFDDTLYRG